MRLLRATSQFVHHAGWAMLFTWLFGACALADLGAWAKMEATGRHFILMNSATIHHMALIDFLHAHRWMFAAYAAIFLFCLFWSEFRGYSIWWKAATFICLALPCIVYANACLHIAGKIIFF